MKRQKGGGVSRANCNTRTEVYASGIPATPGQLTADRDTRETRELPSKRGKLLGLISDAWVGMVTPFLKNPWFSSLATPDAHALLQSSVPMRFKQGELLFCQGDGFDGPAGVYFGLAAGLVKLSIAYPNRKEVILTVIEQGNWFGAGPVLQRRPRAHIATAIKNCEVFVVSAPKFDDLMNRPGFAGALARQMAERLRLAYASMGATALLSTREDGRSTISTSQDVLAMMLGISRPTINKKLHALAKLGLISVRYGRIELSEAFDATDVVSRHF